MKINLKYGIVITLYLFLIGCKTSLTFDHKENLINQINDIFLLDQQYARTPPQELKDKYGHDKAWQIHSRKRDSIQQINQLKIKKIFSKYGYIEVNKIGEETTNKIFFIVQHADNDIQFQKKMLNKFKKELNNNGNKSNYAFLEDRINKNTKNKQRFGTQLTYNAKGQAVPIYGLVDSIKVDSLRGIFNLESYKDYLNRMTIIHYEMNKVYFLEKGITEPQVY